MNRHHLSLLAAAAALAAIPAAVSAHRMWFLPSGTVFSGTDSWVTVDAAVSMICSSSRSPARPAGEREGVAARRLARPAPERRDRPLSLGLRREARQAGTWKIGSETATVMGSFKVNGEEKRIGRRGPPQPARPRR
ncbi:hypothetical protein AB5I41_18070 [Sphingomonas sp. MMS24-JH45]